MTMAGTVKIGLRFRQLYRSFRKVRPLDEEPPTRRGELGHKFMDTFLVIKIQKRVHVESHPAGQLDIPRLEFGEEFLNPLNLFRGDCLDYREHLRSLEEASYTPENRG